MWLAANEEEHNKRWNVQNFPLFIQQILAICKAFINRNSLYRLVCSTFVNVNDFKVKNWQSKLSFWMLTEFIFWLTLNPIVFIKMLLMLISGMYNRFTDWFYPAMLLCLSCPKAHYNLSIKINRRNFLAFQDRKICWALFKNREWLSADRMGGFCYW